MEKDLYLDPEKNGLSEREEVSYWSKQSLVENLKIQARMTKAHDEDINTAQAIEEGRFASYAPNEQSENYLESQKKANSLDALAKLKDLICTLDSRHKNHATEQAAYSPKARAVAEKISTETGGKVQCIVDKEFIDAFGALMGTKYRGSALMGKRVIARDEKVIEDEGMMRHEAIHCMQQRDLNNGKPGMWGFLKRLGLSGISFIGLKLELNGDPDAVNYATQNQLSERETYANQLNPDYLHNREPRKWLEARTPEGRKAVVKAYMEREAIQYKEQIDALKQQYHKEEDIYKKATIIQKITDLKKFFSLQKELNPEDWKYFIILKDEIPEHLNEDPTFQIKFETQDNREARKKIEESERKANSKKKDG